MRFLRAERSNIFWRKSPPLLNWLYILEQWNGVHYPKHRWSRRRGACKQTITFVLPDEAVSHPFRCVRSRHTSKYLLPTYRSIWGYVISTATSDSFSPHSLSVVAPSSLKPFLRNSFSQTLQFFFYAVPNRPPLWFSGQGCNGVRSASWVQLRSYLEEKVTDPV
jgi:hypothetical protein